jgi:hypothetical protein
MTTERFWVIGGEYGCTGFKALRDCAHVEGPFENRDAAREAWKRLSAENSSKATARFSIAAEHITLPQ